MKPTPEQIAAFADGELGERERMAVETAIAADPALARQVAAHRALRQRLGSHFAPITDEVVPDHLTALLAKPTAPVIDLSAERTRRRTLPRWTWIAGPALAASLALMVMWTTQADQRPGLVGEQLASALDNQLVAEQPADAPIRVLLSFRDAKGTYCRAFAGRTESGIACRDEAGWTLRAGAGGSQASAGEYRQAGSEAEIMQAAQDLAAEPALDDAGERTARQRGWRPAR
ncbi:MAG: anti-sigma factor [Novosphingobium sp.]